MEGLKMVLIFFIYLITILLYFVNNKLCPHNLNLNNLIKFAKALLFLEHSNKLKCIFTFFNLFLFFLLYFKNSKFCNC